MHNVAAARSRAGKQAREVARHGTHDNVSVSEGASVRRTGSYIYAITGP